MAPMDTVDSFRRAVPSPGPSRLHHPLIDEAAISQPHGDRLGVGAADECQFVEGIEDLISVPVNAKGDTHA